MSTAQFTCPLIVTIPGQLIASSLWNNEFTNIYTNGNPSGIGAYSDTDPQMQTATDPFPSGTSRPTSLAGELERIRYILNLIIGGTYWYNHPAIDLATINSTYDHFASGTRLIFYQAAAPTGWTQVVTNNDMALRVVSGTGGGTGGTNNMSTGLSHSHTVASHTHDLGNHTHTMGNHTHSTPNHTHELDFTTFQTISPFSESGNAVVNLNSDGNDAFMNVQALPASGSSSTVRHYKTGTSSGGSGTSGAPSSNTSDSPSTNTSGAATPGTDTQAPTFKYIDVICASKN